MFTKALFPARPRKAFDGWLSTLLLCALGGVAMASLLTTSAQGINDAATTTTLSIAPGSSVNAEVAVSLTATVTKDGFPVTPGAVSFCDATIGCVGRGILGTAQLTSLGTAALKFTPGVGSYEIEAVFQGTGSTALSSTSSPQILTVIGISSYASTTTLGASGSAGNYTLTATVSAFGRVTPTGNVSFIDTTGGNFTVASANLDPASLIFSFTPGAGSPLPAGNGSYFVAAGDLNNDGIPDLVTPDNNDATVAVLLGNGDGTFQTATLNGTGVAPVAAKVGDFNGDGFLDIAVANSGSGTVSILLGNGDGTFQNQVTYGVGNAPNAVAVADLNRDGNLDLVVVNTTDGTASVLLGNGDGTFQAQTVISVGTGPWDVLVGDFNGDGIPDIASANRSDNALGILLGNGDGTFAAAVPYATGSYPDAVSTGDFNGDGFADLVVGNYLDGTVSVLLGNGDGTFQNQSVYNAGPAVARLAVGDFNGDNTLDIAAPNANVGTLTLLFGNGDGTFQTQPAYTVGNTPLAVASVDLNGDGLADLAVVNCTEGSTGTLSILLGEQILTATASGVDVPGSGTQDTLAMYPGDSSRAASQSSTLGLTGGPLLASATTLASSANPIQLNQAVTFTATVTASSGSPTGTVTFKNGNAVLGVSALNGSSQASYTTSTLPVGDSVITAVYAGDTHYGASTSSSINEVVNPASPAATTTALTASASHSVFGTAVTFTATVSSNSGSPAGSVNFWSGSTALGSAALNGASEAIYTTSQLPVGTDAITAEYTGNANYATSTSVALDELVSGSGPLATTTELHASLSDSYFGNSITFTATVTPAPSGSALGTVSFYSGSTLLGKIAPAAGTATLTTSALAGGSDSVTAVYSGDASLAASTSAAVVEAVKPVFSLAGPSTPITLPAGKAGSLTVEVTPMGGTFDGNVTMSASGLPPNMVATFTPANVMLQSSAVSTTLAWTFQSSQQASNTPAQRGQRNPWIPLSVVAGACFMAKKRKSLPRYMSTLALLMIVGGSLGLTGCAGGTGIESVPPTQGQTYTVTITGTSGTLQRSTTISMIVQ